MGKDNVLILGATGMLGSTLFRRLSFHGLSVAGTVRGAASDRLLGGVDAMAPETVWTAIEKVQPSTVINCIGVIRQRSDGQDPIQCITLNSLFPHQLAQRCEQKKIRVIHVSTDCVFSGKKGQAYLESDFPDAGDVYGRTKFLGEIQYSNSITLRTSIIGHEQRGRLSLVEWFLSQTGRVRGFSNAIYSGLPTVELSNVIAEYVLPRPDLIGLYQVSSNPISKCDLLKKIALAYGRSIEIVPDDSVSENKSLDSSRFQKSTGWISPDWDRLIKNMHADFMENLNAQR